MTSSRRGSSSRRGTSSTPTPAATTRPSQHQAGQGGEAGGRRGNAEEGPRSGGTGGASYESNHQTDSSIVDPFGREYYGYSQTPPRQDPQSGPPSGYFNAPWQHGTRGSDSARYGHAQDWGGVGYEYRGQGQEIGSRGTGTGASAFATSGPPGPSSGDAGPPIRRLQPEPGPEYQQSFSPYAPPPDSSSRDHPSGFDAYSSYMEAPYARRPSGPESSAGHSAGPGSFGRWDTSIAGQVGGTHTREHSTHAHPPSSSHTRETAIGASDRGYDHGQVSSVDDRIQYRDASQSTLASAGLAGGSGGLPVDAGLHRATENAMHKSKKGTEKANEQDWVFGPPLSVREGMFAGKVLRFAAQCVQQPVYGRRKTDKDRRPLAPVPIVRLKIRQCIMGPYDQGWTEEDLDASTLEPSFLVCACELSRPSDQVPDSITFPGSTEGPPDMRQHTGQPGSLSGSGGGGGGNAGTQILSHNPNFGGDPGGPSGSVIPGYPSPRDSRPTIHPGASFGGRSLEPLRPMQYVERGTLPGPSSLRHRASWVADGHWDTSSLAHGMQAEPTQAAHRSTTHPDRFRRRGRVGDDDRYELDEGDEEVAPGARTPKRVKGEGGVGSGLGTGQTAGTGTGTPGAGSGAGYGEHQRNLYGTLHVTSVRVPDLDGEMGLWFLFTDVCIRQEGTYSLRFRIFDLSVVSPEVSPVPDLGACESRTFKVYSPRNFPGLPKPTELSEHFVKLGFKLNTRKNERQAKTPTPSPPPPGRLGED